jgi:hypothetical protein
VGPSGITLVDTIDLRKPFSEVVIKNEDMLSDITSTSGMAFAVGGHKLLVLNLKTQKGVEVIATHKISANATLIRQYGDRFWIAGKEELMWFKMEAPDKIEMVAATKLEASAIDIMAHKNGVVVLDKHGVTLHGLDEDKGLKQFCWMELDVEPDSILMAGGVLTGITGRKQGSRFIDFSDVKSPQIVATYRDPHWFSGMTIDVTRNMTYRFDTDKKLIEIGMIRTRRTEKK